MGRIHRLDDHVINKIAAGEVVERPASVVKELVENAIDAGAKKVRVELEQGGQKRIVIRDDGSGMAADDCQLALTRHATSKIRAAEDLVNVASMGFRGEALASIAAVSRLTITTSPAAGEGTRLQSVGGEQGEPRPWQGPQGTTIAVEDLFFNVPARARFLKQPATEFAHCHELIHALALGHPDVGFELIHNDKERLRVAAAGDRKDEAAVRARCAALWGDEIAQAMVWVSGDDRFGSLWGLVSPPGYEKPHSKLMFTFVNHRWVKDKTVRYGILRGYHSHLLKGRFPQTCLFLDSPPELVDVNVHPAKTELRFQYASDLQGLMARVLREGLRRGAQQEWQPAGLGITAPGIGAGSMATTVPRATPSPAMRTSAPSRSSGFGPPTAPVRAGGATSSSVFSGAAPAMTGETAVPPASFGFDNDMTDGETSADTEPKIAWGELDFLGAFGRCFLFFECQSTQRLLVVDQHAFHERILFERLQRDQSLLNQSQKLLVPELVGLDGVHLQALKEQQDLLASRGFEFMALDDTTLELQTVPSILQNADPQKLLAALAGADAEDEGREVATSNGELAGLTLATIACHAAVRSGEELPETEMRVLMKEAEDVDFVHHCPHGRRVFRWFSRGQVERWFDR